MALRARAATRDIEFVQFHPTVLDLPRTGGRDVLISEAVRGEGAVLIDAQGTRFMKALHPLAELAPRDVVSAEIINHIEDTGAEQVFLDARSITDFPQRFPTIHAELLARGIDATVDPFQSAQARTIIAAASRLILTGAPALKDLAPSAKSPARACKAQTGWPRIL